MPLGGPATYAPLSERSLQHVRCLPCAPGDAVIMSHRVVHWGSQGRNGARLGPRLSFSFASSDHTFEPPYLKALRRRRSSGEGEAPQGPETSASPSAPAVSSATKAAAFSPPFAVRLALACGQMLCYAGNGRFALASKAEVARYTAAFRAQKQSFSVGYRAKVRSARREALRLCGDDDGDGDGDGAQEDGESEVAVEGSVAMRKRKRNGWMAHGS
jgi:hypothetical protein